MRMVDDGWRCAGDDAGDAATAGGNASQTACRRRQRSERIFHSTYRRVARITVAAAAAATPHKYRHNKQYKLSVVHTMRYRIVLHR